MPNVLTTTYNVQDSHFSDYEMYVSILHQQYIQNNYINNSFVNIEYDSDSSSNDSMPPLIDDNNDNDLYDDELSDTGIILSDPPGIDLHPKQNALLP